MELACLGRLAPAALVPHSSMVSVGIRIEADKDMRHIAGIREVLHHFAVLADATVFLCLAFEFIHLYGQGVRPEVQEDVWAARAPSDDTLVEAPVDISETFTNELPNSQLLAAVEACSLVLWEKECEATYAIALVCWCAKDATVTYVVMFAQVRFCPCGVSLGVVCLGTSDAAAGGFPVVYVSGASIVDPTASHALSACNANVITRCCILIIAVVTVMFVGIFHHF